MRRIFPTAETFVPHVDAMIIELKIRAVHTRPLMPSLEVLAKGGGRNVGHDRWPVEVRTRWSWPAEAIEQILAIHSRRMQLSRS
jgi:hypothetical protein